MFDVKLRIFKKSGKLFNDLIKLIANHQSTFSTGISVLITIIAFLLPFAVVLWIITVGWEKIKFTKKS